MEAVPMMEAVHASSRFKRMTDEQVVQQCKNRDNYATEYLLRKYKKVILFKSRSYFLHGADRDDMIQEGMIGLFKAIRDFMPDRACSFRSFADVCITRQMITAVKSATGQRHLPIIYAASLSPGGGSEENEGKRQLEIAIESEAIDPEKLLIARENVRELRAILRETLSEFEWNVFVAFVEDKSYQEIAEEQGKSAKSIDNALCRVRRKVQKFRAQQKLQERSDITAPSQSQEVEDHDSKDLSELTISERQVFRYHSKGLSNTEIAEKLRKTEGVITQVLNRAHRKLGEEEETQKQESQDDNGQLLTSSESEILRCKALGLSSREIANARGVSKNSIDRALSQARKKLAKESKLQDQKTEPLTDFQKLVYIYHLRGLSEEGIAKVLGYKRGQIESTLEQIDSKLGDDGRNRKSQGNNGRFLSGRERRVLAYRLEGLTNPEIAQSLGCTEKCVRNAFSRARSKLKNHQSQGNGQLFSKLQSQVLLHHLDGLSNQEIAEILGRTYNSVNSALRRARFKLEKNNKAPKRQDQKHKRLTELEEQAFALRSKGLTYLEIAKELGGSHRSASSAVSRARWKLGEDSKTQKSESQAKVTSPSIPT